jgi:hypothetical protein
MKNLRKMIKLSRNLIEYAENIKMRKCFEKWLNRGFHLGAFMTVNFSAIMIIMTASPIILLFFNIKAMMIGVILPFSDTTSTEGFMSHYVYHFAVCLLCDLTFFAPFTLINDFLFHFLAFFDSLFVLVEILEDVIKAEKSDENDEEIKRILSKLVDGHNLCNEFLKTFESSFKYYHMIEIGGSMFGTAVQIFALRKVSNIKTTN